MRHALPLALAALILGGCASHKPEDLDGTWINQDAIDSAVKSGRITQTLNKHGLALEWKLDVAKQAASYTNGFEAVDGHLVTAKEPWEVRFSGDQGQQLGLSGDTLTTNDPEVGKQRFVRSKTAGNAPLGGSFERALYQAYLGGDWKIVEGQGKGAVVRFSDTGSVTGLPGPDRFALCLAGDCADMGGSNDSLWLERNQRGAPWMFKRDGDTLEIYQAVNLAQPDEKPQLTPGARQWLLEKD
ncbi:hypothetical protein [Pseudomonas sp. RIT623]|uniref:hypothetical protein n=1 Tax=Pseudomonas sp. RIT623 TaxID=2559075 RepID=UPI00106F3B5D|nr:hypothetical protein [Pseudomonas sp. RIT623]TFF43276.1 hypothetical protein E3U47_01645 [Pseudomonas sp. RIT623]